MMINGLKKGLSSFRSYSTQHQSINDCWSNLKKANYGKSIDEKSIVLQDGELEIKYTKDVNKVVKEVLHRHIDNAKQELTYPQSQIDEKAFNYFIKQDIYKNIKHTTHLFSHLEHGPFKQNFRSFAILNYNEHKLEKKLSIGPDITVSTSVGDKVVSGLSMHRGKIQVNAFKDVDDVLLCRVQNSKYAGISTPYLRLGDKALLTDTELMMQYDLYCIERDLYNQIILRTSKLNNDVEVVSHFTGMLKKDSDGNVIFERLKGGIERPKTVFNPNKGKFVSMESHEGNTASLEYIAYKTQSFAKEYELIFIPKTHKHIKQIVNVCKALLDIKNTSTQDSEVLDLILRKYGLSNDEVAVELVREINKHDTLNGIFHVNIKEFREKNLKIAKFVLGANFLDNKNLSYKLEVSKEKDLYNEPIITAYDQPYEKPIDYKVIGSSDDSDGFV